MQRLRHSGAETKEGINESLEGVVVVGGEGVSEHKNILKVDPLFC